ncbi:hypothetical protein CONCODRAFT_20505 [Conidiobolus coronatus NRRL 28638]|uniref:Uncharacterized protein n=1 Tax=Conidiobolus coronatus (strain ATCC 28846 / CBS 209.66 / NRRL 28638) TaxID=796925 RepID=A0A137NT72_CONC2|nr:hypothetical protein CONCODRAFT_20505 [Conidiobolus coronatus NRRL 28638]|eukprot:KXN65908.1 hypothetical protein CONCODRAFT_20505 [Conidiobolus coronatus NRRL 28638]
MKFNIVYLTTLLNFASSQTTSSSIIKELCPIGCIGNKFCEKTCEVTDPNGVYKKVDKCEAGTGFINKFNCTGEKVGLKDYQTNFWISVYGKQVDCQKPFDENAISCATNCTGKVDTVNDVADCTRKCANLKKPTLVSCFIDMTFGNANSTKDYTKWDTCQSKCKDAEGDDWSELFNCNLDCMEPLYLAWELDVPAARGAERPSGKKDTSNNNKGSFAQINSVNGLALASTLLLALLSTL